MSLQIHTLKTYPPRWLGTFRDRASKEVIKLNKVIEWGGDSIGLIHLEGISVSFSLPPSLSLHTREKTMEGCSEKAVLCKPGEKVDPAGP